MFKNTNSASNSLQTFFDEFKQYTTDELWDSDEDLIHHYQNPTEYEKLLNGVFRLWFCSNQFLQRQIKLLAYALIFINYLW